MAANRGLVSAVAFAVLVWGVAFGGGLTIAVLTSSVDVTATFETPDDLNETSANLTQLDGPPETDLDATSAPVENETGEEDELTNGTAPPENASAPPDDSPEPTENVSSPEKTSSPSDDPITNDSAPAKDETVPPEDEAPPEDETPADDEMPAEDGAPTEDEPPAEDEAPPEDEPPAEDEAPPEDEPPTEDEAPAEDEAPQRETTTDTEDPEPTATADPEPTAPDPTGNTTGETAQALGDDLPASTSIAVHPPVGISSPFASEA